MFSSLWVSEKAADKAGESICDHLFSGEKSPNLNQACNMTTDAIASAIITGESAALGPLNIAANLLTSTSTAPASIDEHPEPTADGDWGRVTDEHIHENCSCPNFVDSGKVGASRICGTCNHYQYNHPAEKKSQLWNDDRTLVDIVHDQNKETAKRLREQKLMQAPLWN